MMYGLEKEFFALDARTKKMVLPNNVGCFPVDGCGWLVEARGKPAESITDAVFLLQAEIFRLQQQAKEKGLVLVDTPVMKVPKEITRVARRHYVKDVKKDENLYGHEEHRNRMNESTAGVHISFTNPIRTEVGKNNEVITYNGMFDWVKRFQKLDKAFSKEIKDSKRKPGFYELKADGRIEYRSLPANVSLEKVIEVVNGI